MNALQAFNNVRSRYNLSNNWPSPVPHLSLFISYCLEAGYSPLTITTYLLGISFHHKLYNLEDPTAAFIVKKLLEGRRRMRPRHDKRAPITESEYSQYYQIFVFSQYERILFRTAYATAFFGVLRISEVVFSSQFQASKPLLEADVRLGREQCVVNFHKGFKKIISKAFQLYFAFEFQLTHQYVASLHTTIYEMSTSRQFIFLFSSEWTSGEAQSVQ